MSGAACTGFPVSGHELAIIPIRDEPIPTWDERLRLPPGQVGEIVIRGPAVTGAYLGHPELTARAKIWDGAQLWHRMGDLGCLDESGCLWLVGRKTQRVQTAREVLFTIPCEAVFNQHPAVARSALVGRGVPGQQVPVIVIEPKPGQAPRSASEKAALLSQLRALGQAHAHTRPIHDFVIYPRPFPVDIRHNSKILREKLRVQ
jgi:acyl-CoA synthetase (AMP-forming)/AMP-acid ligase II